MTIKNIEKSIIDRGYKEGWIIPDINSSKSEKKVAVVGSGPAGLACAQQLARAGHSVVVFEKNDRIGGLLRYGIPNFKMEKHYIDKRVIQMEKEGVTFECNIRIGLDISFSQLDRDFDAIVRVEVYLNVGSTTDCLFGTSEYYLSEIIDALKYNVKVSHMMNTSNDLADAVLDNT